MPKTKLYIDCQIFQTDAFDRGMGKYSLSLLKAFFKAYKSEYETVLIINKNLPFGSKHETVISAAIAQYSILKIDLPTELVEETNKKYAKAESELTNAITLKSDTNAVYLVLAPFFVSFAAVFPKIDSIKKIVLVYDIIPQLIWHKQHIFPDELYFRHFSIFIDAHYIVAISDAVNSDLVNIIGVPKEKVVTIDGGPFESTISSKNPNTYKYILYPSAPIVHKNNSNAITGFKIFNELHNNEYKLLLTSRFDDDTAAKLRGISTDAIFTGNVSDAELTGLYKDSTAVLFASLTEGLGMPVLEAVQYSKPIACSDIPVLREISEKAFYFFDPTNPREISSALDNAVKQKNWNYKLQQYKDIKSKYTWARSAKILSTVINKKNKIIINKEHLHIVTPDPRKDSAVSKIVESLYMQLAEKYDINVVLTKSRGSASPSFVPHMPRGDGGVRLFITDSFRRPRGYNQDDIHITLSSGKRKMGLLFTKHRPDIVVTAHRVITNSSLQLYKWNYEVSRTNIAGVAEPKLNKIMLIQRVLK